MKRDNVLSALACAASARPQCSHLCEYAVLQEFPFVCDVEIDGRQYAVECNTKKLLKDAMKLLKKDGDA